MSSPNSIPNNGSQMPSYYTVNQKNRRNSRVLFTIVKNLGGNGIALFGRKYLSHLSKQFKRSGRIHRFHEFRFILAHGAIDLLTVTLDTLSLVSRFCPAMPM